MVTLTKGEAKVDKTIAVTFDFAADDRFVTEVNAFNATQVEVKFCQLWIQVMLLGKYLYKA